MERDKGIYLDWNRIKRQSRMNPAITRMEQDKETLSYTWAINTKKNYVRKSVSPSRSQSEPRFLAGAGAGARADLNLSLSRSRYFGSAPAPFFVKRKTK